MDLSEFKIPLNRLSSQLTFKTRAGETLSYRLYPQKSTQLLVLFHGAGGNSRYMCVLAHELSKKLNCTVVTPDLRGHGASLGQDKNLAPGQIEQDFEELLIHLRLQLPIQNILLAGHSLGGGFVIRLALSALASQFQSFTALAPRIPARYGAYRNDFGGWIQPAGDGFKVNMDPKFQTGQEKLEYTGDYLRAVRPPENLFELLQKQKLPLKVFLGAEDQVTDANRQNELFSAAGVETHIIEGLNHLTIVSKPVYLDLW